MYGARCGSESRDGASEGCGVVWCGRVDGCDWVIDGCGGAVGVANGSIDGTR